MIQGGANAPPPPPPNETLAQCVMWGEGGEDVGEGWWERWGVCHVGEG